MYYNIKRDDKGHLYMELEEEGKHSHYMLLDTSTNKMYCNEFVLFEIGKSEDYIKLGMSEVHISLVRPITTGEAADIFSIASMSKPNIVKETKSRITPVNEGKYPPFTRVVVKAILTYGRDIQLSQEDHTKKISLISAINKIAETGDKELSVNKADEVLKLYTLNLEVLFKEELVK